MYIDPRSKAWSRLERDWVYKNVGVGQQVPTYNCDFIPRQDLLARSPPMYMTQGHYGDHNDQLLEYVRQGGGLVVGGHAWWWAEQQPDQSVLLQHPGNQLITEFGLAFSKETVDIRDAAFPIKVTEVPSVKVTIQLKVNKII